MCIMVFLMQCLEEHTNDIFLKDNISDVVAVMWKYKIVKVSAI